MIISFILVTSMFDSGLILYGDISVDYFLGFKLDSLHFSIYLNPSFERFFPEKVILPINEVLPSSIELRNN